MYWQKAEMPFMGNDTTTRNFAIWIWSPSCVKKGYFFNKTSVQCSINLLKAFLHNLTKYLQDKIGKNQVTLLNGVRTSLAALTLSFFTTIIT